MICRWNIEECSFVEYFQIVSDPGAEAPGFFVLTEGNSYGRGSNLLPTRLHFPRNAVKYKEHDIQGT